MQPDGQGSPGVRERINRSLTPGCLTTLIVLILVLGSGLSWLWYTDWHAGKVNSERRQKAVSSILRQARDAADDTARSLNASRTSDVDRLTGVIWKHTGAPLITYDTSRREFTARLSQQVPYETVQIIPGGGSDAVTRCFDFTYSRPHGQAWTPRVTVRDDDVCRPATDIGYLARVAKARVERIDAQELTRTGVQRALDPTGTLHTFTVKSVVGGDGTVAISIRITSHEGRAGQCYRITRPAPGSGEVHPSSVIAAPAFSC
ncbi:hypothetical protein AQI88_39515 [Streptomyces cellostaticus]|uniref:Uncharacterized protein n=1 Tax=Streptomyces cellostaticus TaxID=67285 RepID=A0A117PSX0_9ACTN|nr:hypothetical protein [Streptomyces cellostaticus]KUM89750.1 hypothetical protein AQI88_39515 [Streptomyces cellostaticus]GHI10218.1 hypothetical protein Scel_85390 [Streptomyces cellostaticus]